MQTPPIIGLLSFSPRLLTFREPLLLVFVFLPDFFTPADVVFVCSHGKALFLTAVAEL